MRTPRAINHVIKRPISLQHFRHGFFDGHWGLDVIYLLRTEPNTDSFVRDFEEFAQWIPRCTLLSTLSYQVDQDTFDFNVSKVKTAGIYKLSDKKSTE